MNHEVLFQAGTILFPVELLVGMGDPPCVISTMESLLFRMRFSRLFFVYLLFTGLHTQKAYTHTGRDCFQLPSYFERFLQNIYDTLKTG